VENAGAEAGALILASGGRMLVQASSEPGSGQPTVMQAAPLADAPYLSEGIVNYVTRTRRHVVLDDATRRSRFRNDPHVQAASPKSVLCAPIIHKGALTGALYLENNLVTGAFTPDRLEAINILLSQIAVSIENATLYAQQEHQARTIERANVVLTKEIADRKRAEEELSRYRDHLEELVVERTRELEEAQSHLVDLSRRAGMAEVAAGVLHNVGNVMNSVNVGASVAREAVVDMPIDAVVMVADLINAHAHELDVFLLRDARGRKIPEYLDKLGKALSDRRRGVIGNIDYLLEHLDHMKRIVSAQQTYAKNGGVMEACSLGELLETALTLSAVGLRESHLQIVREIEPLPPLLVDRHRLLQIVVNLLSNARHALEERDGDEPRVLKVIVRAAGEQNVCIEVEDNGIGIAPEVMSRIFSHGFTTRRNGHGFGLHNSANTAQAMNGRLTAHSRGRGLGARFVLQIPFQPAEDARQVRHG
jgi:signal transduction histidine kinase